ncbi:EAL domain-containing protein [Bacillus sp. V3B]|uniref:EAL domain-containing protein n=1 Tax=Bacillus sp. V3B TaxID=2804915 RepID=UPI00210A130D|nr:EAL domain-containing protein [Bacillus sp. V3B]MCQ6276548.1 EAL domain-containing protein [Bacillus sp. V3B]
MVRRIFRKLSKSVHWGKLFLPLHQIRYFPPRFVIRDPIIEGVSNAFNKGYEVAMVVYKIKNLFDLTQRYGAKETEKIIHRMKKVFYELIKREFRKDDIILMDYHFSEGFSLYIQVNEEDEKSNIVDIDTLMKKLHLHMNRLLMVEMADIHFVFDKGYMFIEKRYESIQEAIYIARQQALTMAEKRVRSEYNEMLYEMSKIVSKKNVRLLGQPIVDMQTKEIRAWEMLTRGPEGTNLEMPLRLFSVARQTGNLYELEMLILEKVFEKIKETNCKQKVFVNCTPLTLGNKHFVQDLKRLLDQFIMINPNKLIIEMTEQDTVDEKKDLIYNINLLRTLGFRFALDDTGSGYSSFQSIGEILPEIIKIDRSVIQNIHENSVNESMLKGILLIAKEVGSRVVAEGIEKEEEAILLSRHKVDFAQGYYFARPAVFNHQLLSSL